jgi:hypothetical protein
MFYIAWLTISPAGYALMQTYRWITGQLVVWLGMFTLAHVRGARLLLDAPVLITSCCLLVG